MKWPIIFLVFCLLLQSVFLFGLSEGEIEILPELSKETLIEIILVQDQGLKSSEISMKKLQDLINKLKIQQQKDSAQLKIQTTLYQESLTLQAEKDALQTKHKLLIGGVSFLSGALGGYLLR